MTLSVLGQNIVERLRSGSRKSQPSIEIAILGFNLAKSQSTVGWQLSIDRDSQLSIENGKNLDRRLRFSIGS